MKKLMFAFGCFLLLLSGVEASGCVIDPEREYTIEERRAELLNVRDGDENLVEMVDFLLEQSQEKEIAIEVPCDLIDFLATEKEGRVSRVIDDEVWREFVMEMVRKAEIFYPYESMGIGFERNVSWKYAKYQTYLTSEKVNNHVWREFLLEITEIFPELVGTEFPNLVEQLTLERVYDDEWRRLVIKWGKMKYLPLWLNHLDERTVNNSDKKKFIEFMLEHDVTRIDKELLNSLTETKLSNEKWGEEAREMVRRFPRNFDDSFVQNFTVEWANSQNDLKFLHAIIDGREYFSSLEFDELAKMKHFLQKNEDAWGLLMDVCEKCPETDLWILLSNIDFMPFGDEYWRNAVNTFVLPSCSQGVDIGYMLRNLSLDEVRNNDWMEVAKYLMEDEINPRGVLDQLDLALVSLSEWKEFVFFYKDHLPAQEDPNWEVSMGNMWSDWGQINTANVLDETWMDVVKFVILEKERGREFDVKLNELSLEMVVDEEFLQGINYPLSWWEKVKWQVKIMIPVVRESYEKEGIVDDGISFTVENQDDFYARRESCFDFQRENISVPVEENDVLEDVVAKLMKMKMENFKNNSVCATSAVEEYKNIVVRDVRQSKMFSGIWYGNVRVDFLWGENGSEFGATSASWIDEVNTDDENSWQRDDQNVLLFKKGGKWKMTPYYIGGGGGGEAILPGNGDRSLMSHFAEL